MKNNFKKLKKNQEGYSYNRPLGRLLSYLAMLAILPINIALYRSGFYGPVDLDIGYLGKIFLQDQVRDLPLMVLLIFGLAHLLRDLFQAEARSSPIVARDYQLENTLYLILALVLIGAYFFFRDLASLVTFLALEVLAQLIVNSSFRELTKKKTGP